MLCMHLAPDVSLKTYQGVFHFSFMVRNTHYVTEFAQKICHCALFLLPLQRSSIMSVLCSPHWQQPHLYVCQCSDLSTAAQLTHKDIHCMTQHSWTDNLIHLCGPFFVLLVLLHILYKRRTPKEGHYLVEEPNEPLWTMMKITTNLSLQEAAVQWTGLGPTYRTFWLVDLEPLLFRGQYEWKSLSLTETKWGRAE